VTALQPSRHRWRAVLGVAVAALVAVAAPGTLAACTGGPHGPSVADISAAPSSGSPSTGTSASGDAVAYSRCMRSHGVPNFPDPGSDGRIPKSAAEQLGVGDTQYQAALQACQSQYPAGNGSFDEASRGCYLAGVCPPALVQQMLTIGRAFATCMRSHGFAKFPDPTLDSQGRPVFDLSAAGITHDEWHTGPMRDQGDKCYDEAGGGLASQ
jgi:hypothetical protein